uniref:L antigen family member 3 n=1 Tax=Paramormyrops kingsleyae TaxID=1676925 RepID=A0A3B3QEJ3_9TELE
MGVNERAVQLLSSEGRHPTPRYAGPSGGRSSFLNVPFPSEREASIALGSLAPDSEPRKGGISKEMCTAGNILNVKWSADEARILRVSVGSFLDHLALVLETMLEFGPPVPL